MAKPESSFQVTNDRSPSTARSFVAQPAPHSAPQILGEVEVHETGQVDRCVSGVRLRKYPFPYVAALAMSNDCDKMWRGGFEDWHSFVNGRGPTAYGDGLGLEVGDSFFGWAGANVPIIGIHRHYPDEKPVLSPDVGRIVELSRLGWFDTLHSLGNWRTLGTIDHEVGHRDQAKYLLDVMDRLGIRPRVFVNHSGSPSNVGGPWAWYQKADQPDHSMYCMDLLKQFGFRFFWPDVFLNIGKFGDELEYADIGELTTAIGQYGWGPWLRCRRRDGSIIPLDLPSEEAEKRAFLLSLFNKTITPVKGGDGERFLAFKRHRGEHVPVESSLPLQATADDLDDLEKRRGVVIIYQHLCAHGPRGRANAISKPLRRPAVPPVFDEHSAAWWRDVADRAYGGRLFVATTGRLLAYLWVRDNLVYSVEKSDSYCKIVVLGVDCPVSGRMVPARSDFNGLAFLVPAEFPQVTVFLDGISTPLDTMRQVDAAYPGYHAVFLKWRSLEWLPDESAGKIASQVRMLENDSTKLEASNSASATQMDATVSSSEERPIMKKHGRSSLTRITRTAESVQKVAADSLQFNEELTSRANDQILEFFKEEEAAGQLYQWYKNRFLPNSSSPSGFGVSPYCRAIASFLLGRFGGSHHFIEVGAAAAQASLLMSLHGARTVAIEGNEMNFQLMQRLLRRLTERLDSSLPRRFLGVHGYYPGAALPHLSQGSILLFPTLSMTQTEEQERLALDTLKRADGVLLGLRDFFRPRDSEEERLKLVNAIRDRGFGAPETVLRWENWTSGFHPNHWVFMVRT